jgi:hypothetical protein
VSLSQALASLRASTAQIGTLTGARGEQSLYGPFDQFLADATVALSRNVLVVQQVGAHQLVPDCGLFRSNNVIGWVELKAPSKDLKLDESDEDE